MSNAPQTQNPSTQNKTDPAGNMKKNDSNAVKPAGSMKSEPTSSSPKDKSSTA